MQLVRGLVAREPVVIARKHSPEMKHQAEQLLKKENYDRVVCDFLTSTVNLPFREPFILFEHNVETQIWRRYAERAEDPLRKWYFLRQAERVREFERSACGRASRVIAVSKADADLLGELHGISNVAVVPTGVDAAHFAKPSLREAGSGLVFCGSMDWRPNIDGILWFVREVLPIVHRRQPDCTLTIAGRTPSAAIRELVADHPLVRVTGTVDDVRPYLWAGRASIVPLHVGGGTRLKVYESMAAHVPVVSTTVGAEGLEVSSPENIRIADSAETFAEACLKLLEDPAERERQASAAVRLVRERFSWQKAADRFDEILQS
jgi:glycosyltransferase involved in cell wall biosynthesis